MRFNIQRKLPFIGWKFPSLFPLPTLDEDSSQEVRNVTLWWMHHKINSTSHNHWRTHLHNMCSWQVFTTQHSITSCSSLCCLCGSWCSKAVGPCIPASVSAMLPGQCLQHAPLALLPSHPVEVLGCRLLFCHRSLRSFHCTVLTFGFASLPWLLKVFELSLHWSPQLSKSTSQPSKTLSSPACVEVKKTRIGPTRQPERAF